MPDARPDDGLLDVAVLQTRTVLDWLVLAARVLLRRRRSRSSATATRWTPPATTW